ncbi:unnamed protein product [Cuscuta epithymum]|uniref:Uncharacterized protein n=1 Tax=Cuscuta epithymum TaxID=186058 RepID=A0AAV0CDX4_9ASTE|nr:unnamed protein product [Cuscuta epithymum]CAH9145246.1 unnamed protein product [Cuscuta epithymum]
MPKRTESWPAEEEAVLCVGVYLSTAEVILDSQEGEESRRSLNQREQRANGADKIMMQMQTERALHELEEKLNLKEKDSLLSSGINTASDKHLMQQLLTHGSMESKERDVEGN